MQSRAALTVPALKDVTNILQEIKNVVDLSTAKFGELFSDRLDF